MKQLLPFFLLVFGINFHAAAQVSLYADTLRNLPYVCQADSFTVTVSGMHGSPTYVLDSVNFKYRNDSLLIGIYYDMLPGIGVISPFTLPLKFPTSLPGFYTIYSKRYLWGNPTHQGTSHIGVCTSTTGVKSKASEVSEFKIFPNPTQNILNIEGPEKGLQFSAQLTDLSGKVLLTRNFKPTERQKLNIEYLPPGLYLLILSTEKRTSVKKILKN